MTAAQLRNSILQEAISGRLVPQDPNDEPAEIVSTVPEDEVPFEIPSTWRWVNFFSVYTLETNLVDPTLYFDYNHIAPDNIVKKQGKLLKCNTVREDKVKSNNHLFHKGQIIYSKIRPLLRKAIIAPFDGLCSADMYPLSTTMDTQFALIYLLSDAFNNQVSSICASRVKMPKINKAELATIVVPLPPLAEQKRIVAKLEELLPIVEQYGKAQKELDELNAALPARLRQSILQEAISGRLVPQDPNDEPASALLARIREEKARLVKEGKLKKKDLVETPITEEEIPFEIPESWKWLRYQDIADCALGKTKNPNQTDGELCPYLCSINVYWDSVRLNVLKEMLFSDTDKQKYSVENGDMLICEGGEAGRSAIYEGDVTPLYYQNALHRVRFYGHLCAKFYLYQMELYKKTGLLNEHIKGETIQHFVSTKLLNLPIPLPPLAEQQRIVAKIEELFEQIDKITK